MIIRPSAKERAEMEAERAALQRLQFGIEPFEDFVKRVRPRFWPVPEHLQPLYRLIERSRHEQVFALVSMPPRHGKSTTFQLGLAYRCLYDPACQHAYATYTTDLSKETGNAVRAMCIGLGMSIGKSTETSVKGTSSMVLDWKLPQGGGLKSTSVGGGITGRGVDGLLLIDDPIKGIEAANSPTERERIWQWLRFDILSRLQGGGSVIIVQTRWHEDDPIGRMLTSGPDWVRGLGRDYEHINMPAMRGPDDQPIDEREHPDLARPLWESINDRYPNNPAAAREWYRLNRLNSESAWWALYQGVPRSASAKVFAIDPATWARPHRMAGKRAMLMMDPAATGKTSSDHNALGAFAMNGYGDRVVEVEDHKGVRHMVENPTPSVMDVVEIWKDRIPVPEATKIAKRWQDRYNLPVGIEVQGTGANLPDWIALVEPRMKIIPITTTKDKRTRAIPASKAWNDGRILVPSGMDENGRTIVIGWDVADYIRVMQAFTGLGDTEDDVVDVTTHAWNRMYKEWKPREHGTAVRAPAY